jgi:hypothetical protein
MNILSSITLLTIVALASPVSARVLRQGAEPRKQHPEARTSTIAREQHQ